MFVEKSGVRILVVEDEPTVRDLLQDILHSVGYKVGVAGNGREALEMLGENDYSLILSDFSMPRMDGIKLYQKVAEEFPGLEKKFLFITATVTEEALSFFEEHGCGYMLKPFPPLELLVLINNMLHMREETAWKGPEGRKETRYHWDAECRIFERGIHARTPLDAKTEDISRTGLKVRCCGRPLTPGSSVVIHIKGLYPQRDAKVLWSKNVPGTDSLVGLGFAEPVPIPSNINHRGGRLI